MKARANKESSPWEFRVRAWIAFAIYFFGFFAGYYIDHVVGGTGTSSYVLIGRHWGDFGIRAAAAIAGAFTLVGFLIRWWGSSYHREGVVFSSRIVTDDLTASGPYRFVRNPLYLGNLLQGIGISMIGPPAATVIIIVLLTAFLYQLIFLEEGQLREAQGEAYARYCAAVPRLIPRLTPAQLTASEKCPNIIFGLITELGTLGFVVWIGYLAVANPERPTIVFIVLFYIAIALFGIGGVVNRRMARENR
jgi:protein-S-isoprenylcysteine O-methyltransferase Ste14